MSRNSLWLGAGVLAAIVIATSALGASDESSAATAARERAVTDMPDDIAGPQVHFLYVVPSDGGDRQLDTNGVISDSVASWQAWLRGQTEGRGLRLDTYQGEFDITFLRFAGAFVGRNSLDVLRAAGFNDPTKIYAVYWDGGAGWSACGASWASPPFGILILRGTPRGSSCALFPLGGDPPGYLDFAMLHEIGHALGYVPSCAPHSTLPALGPHVSDSRFDLMYTGNEPWGVGEPGRMQLDVGRDDYFMANVPGCPDLSASPYLASLHSVSVTVRGPGSVTSSPAGIDCPDTCAGKFEGSVTLTATPSAGAAFRGWTGACSGTATCVITGEGSASASFSASSHRRTLTLRVRAQRVSGALRVVDGYEQCLARAQVVIERRGKQSWSIIRKTRTDSAGRFAVSIPTGRATYRARAPETTTNAERCVKAVSRTAATSANA